MESSSVCARRFPALVVAYISIALVLVAMAGCKALPQPESRICAGRVTDQLGVPVNTARVTCNGKATSTDANGDFKVVSGPPVGRARATILNITHPDFAEFSHVSREPLRKQVWRLVRAQVSTVDPTTTFTVIDTRPELGPKGLDGASITIPANSLVGPGGAAPTGPLRATIATLDVGNGEGPGDWNVRNPGGGQDGFLLSYGAFFVQFTDSTGARYQLRSGSTAQIKLPVLPAMKAHAPANSTQAFWYYDGRDGYWKRNGTASYDAGSKSYTGSINHLSTINTDIAKFTDAACLKITLDPSIALGLKLRLRYHSGGTAFGQTPMFVMNDVDNAAYRVPANTNVLLSLLNGSDEEFGNLVVEDPIGTDLPNTVVNTGPPIPSGHTLWPPAPFTDCKPIKIKLGAPTVEIRINEMPGDPATKDNPSDDYITWAPTFARARLAMPMMSPVDVVLTNDTPGRIPAGGDVKFAAYVDPWPLNTTATADTLNLTLPADGSWVEFVVAGKFGTPSTNDKDAIIEAHESTVGGTLIGRKALMVRVRKNGNTLTSSERSRFLFAMRGLRNRVGGANYVRFQEMHRLAATAGDEGHHQPAFFPWHRLMLLEVERELQKIDPSVALHYWDWDNAAPNIFASNFMGAPFDTAGGTALPTLLMTNPLNGWNTELPFGGGELRRSRADHGAAPPAGLYTPLDHPVDDSLIDHTDYGPNTSITTFGRDAERNGHDYAHGWACEGGHLAFPVRSAADPMFYFLHSQVEREWAYWQWKKDRLGVAAGGVLTFPFPQHYDNNGHWDDPGVLNWQKGSFLEDGQWPWDGTSGGAAGRAQRPVNQAPGPDTNVPTSMPLIPMTPFPASQVKNLWPVSTVIPRPRDVIDYLGRFHPQDGLGFAYDDVPYQ